VGFAVNFIVMIGDFLMAVLEWVIMVDGVAVVPAFGLYFVQMLFLCGFHRAKRAFGWIGWLPECCKRELLLLL